MLINWFVHGNKPDRDTGMWTVELECITGRPTFQVIEVETIAHGAHLIHFSHPLTTDYWSCNCGMYYMTNSSTVFIYCTE